MSIPVCFHESVTVGTHHYYYEGDYDVYPGLVQVVIAASTVAFYDKQLQVLIVDHATSGGEWPWAPKPERTLATIATKGEAQRRAILLADEWQARVAAAIPPPPPVEA